MDTYWFLQVLLHLNGFLRVIIGSYVSSWVFIDLFKFFF